MKVYVAAKFEDHERASKLMADLRALGHDQTYDWTVMARNFPPVEEHWKQAVADLDGVLDCDVFIQIHHPKCQGALVELGGALATGKIIVVIGCVERAAPIFYLHPDITHVDSEDEALAYVEGLVMDYDLEHVG